MIPLIFPFAADASPTVLLLGAHCDDIEIGCGATVRRLVETYPSARFHWVVFSSNPVREAEARASSAAFLEGAADATVQIHSFRENHFPWIGDQIKTAMESVRGSVSPDLVLTHCLEDNHQDHRIVAELTHNAFRNHLILEYEIPKYDGDLVPTNVFVPLTRSQIDRKIELLMEVFPSQSEREWFDPETFRGLSRLRGVECNAPDRYAEGFRSRKITFGLESSPSHGSGAP